MYLYVAGLGIRSFQKNIPFFLKEWKRMERTERSFEKNGKERKERSVLLKRTEKNGTFFRKEQKRTEKNGKNGTFF